MSLFGTQDSILQLYLHAIILSNIVIPFLLPLEVYALSNLAELVEFKVSFYSAQFLLYVGLL